MPARFVPENGRGCHKNVQCDPVPPGSSSSSFSSSSSKKGLINEEEKEDEDEEDANPRAPKWPPKAGKETLWLSIYSKKSKSKRRFVDEVFMGYIRLNNV